MRNPEISKDRRRQGRQSLGTWNDRGGRALGAQCDAASSVWGNERRLLPFSTTPPCCKRQANWDLSLCRTTAKFSWRYLKRTVRILTSISRTHKHTQNSDFQRCWKAVFLQTWAAVMAEGLNQDAWPENAISLSFSQDLLLSGVWWCARSL